ncbi:MAG: hypothetical protein MHM6MM_005815 [Cercozoa sp. M6MM]
MLGLFGRPKKKNGGGSRGAGPNGTKSLHDSIIRLKESLSVLEKQEVALSKKSEQAQARARAKMKAGDKRGALFELKRSKMYSKQIDQLYGKRTNIDMQIMALENAAQNKEVFDVMRQGRDALQRHVQEDEVDRVDEVIDDISHSMGLVDEMSQAMSQQIGQDVFDDDELESEIVDEEFLETPATPVTRKGRVSATEPALDLPEQPTGPVRQTAATTEEDELAALEADFAFA